MGGFSLCPQLCLFLLHLRVSGQPPASLSPAQPAHSGFQLSLLCQLPTLSLQPVSSTMSQFHLLLGHLCLDLAAQNKTPSRSHGLLPPHTHVLRSNLCPGHPGPSSCASFPHFCLLRVCPVRVSPSLPTVAVTWAPPPAWGHSTNGPQSAGPEATAPLESISHEGVSGPHRRRDTNRAWEGLRGVRRMPPGIAAGTGQPLGQDDVELPEGPH